MFSATQHIEFNKHLLAGPCATQVRNTLDVKTHGHFIDVLIPITKIDRIIISIITTRDDLIDHKPLTSVGIYNQCGDIYFYDESKI